MKRFDGETNVLWAQLNRIQGFTLNDSVLELARQMGMDELRTRNDIDNIVQEATSRFGSPLHLYWAFGENFDGQISPLVTFTPLGVQQDQDIDLIAYDGKGKSHVVNKAVAMERPVVVITWNERTDSQGNLKRGLIAGSRIESIDAYTVSPSSSDFRTVTSSVATSGRVDGYREDVDRIYLDRDLGDRDGWPFGDSDVYLNVILPSGAVIIQHQMVGEYGTGKWHNSDIPLFRWTTSVHGNWILLDWWDDDGGSRTVGFSFPLIDPNGNTLSTVTVQQQEGDDTLGRKIVNWTDPFTDEHSTGYMSWYCKQTP